MSSTLSPDAAGKKIKDRRFEMRLTEEDDELLDEAAALAGVSRSDLGTAATLVSAEEFATVLAALDAPPEPNDRLRRAAKLWKEQVEHR